MSTIFVTTDSNMGDLESQESAAAFVDFLCDRLREAFPGADVDGVVRPGPTKVTISGDLNSSDAWTSWAGGAGWDEFCEQPDLW